MKQPEQTKEEIKDSLARSRGYYDYSDALRDFYQKDAVHEAIEFTQKWAEAYASQKCKALQEEKQVLYDGLSKSVSSVKALQEENERLKERNKGLESDIEGDLDFQDQQADELEELRLYKHACNESIAHLHRENERLQRELDKANEFIKDLGSQL